MLCHLDLLSSMFCHLVGLHLTILYPLVGLIWLCSVTWLALVTTMLIHLSWLPPDYTLSLGLVSIWLCSVSLIGYHLTMLHHLNWLPSDYAPSFRLVSLGYRDLNQRPRVCGPSKGTGIPGCHLHWEKGAPRFQSWSPSGCPEQTPKEHVLPSNVLRGHGQLEAGQRDGDSQKVASPGDEHSQTVRQWLV